MAQYHEWGMGNTHRVPILQNPEAFSTLKELVEANGGFISAKATAEHLVQEAVAALDIFSAGDTDENLEMLTGIAGYVLSRDR